MALLAPADRPVIGVAGTVRTLDLPFATLEAHTVLADFVRSVTAAGGLPVVLPVLVPELADGLVAGIDGLVLTGGTDVDPATFGRTGTSGGPHDGGRDRFEVALVHAAQRRGVPLLGVCRGLHILNVAGGGTLHGHVDAHLDIDVRHRLSVEPGSTLAGIVGSILDAGSLHHQAVERLGAGLRVVATAEDGTVEAVEAADGSPTLGVQWHPELEAGAAGAPLWYWLVGAARTRQWS